jgi:aryl-alcohol dehydrogenase-like predicted oxidoreductase
MKRREFLQGAAAVTAALAMKQGRADDAAGRANAARLPRRPYGRNGIELSIVGFGGIVVSGAEPAHANRVVAESVERGVNYFDVAPSYGDAEVKLGPALAPYRKSVFLACKTTERGRAAAEKEFNGSLERLKTDYFDLYQLHAITDVAKDVDAAFAADGVMRFLIEAKKAGRVRHLGFSAHSVAAAEEAMERYEFDSILFPVNFAMWHQGHFGPQVLEKAKAKGLSILALKAMARQKWPDNDPAKKRYSKCWYQPLTDEREALMGMAFALDQGITALLPPGEESLYRMALDLAMKVEPLSAEQHREAATLAKGLKPLFEA